MDFMSRCLSGDAFLNEIDEYVEQWHLGVAGENQELHEFLGMTWEEYSLWATQPSLLNAIFNSRKRQISLTDELYFECAALAAQAKNNQEAIKMQALLKRVGKL
ncbi:MAG: hypothetical protein WAX77_02690 [Methylococcaceae bacterium]